MRAVMENVIAEMDESSPELHAKANSAKLEAQLLKDENAKLKIQLEELQALLSIHTKKK